MKYGFAGQLRRPTGRRRPRRRSSRSPATLASINDVLRALRQGHQRRRQARRAVLLHAQQPHGRHAEGGQMSRVRASRWMIASMSLMAACAAARACRRATRARRAARQAAARRSAASVRWAGDPPKTVFLPSPNNPLVRDPRALPRRLRRRPEGQGGPGRAHRRDAGQGRHARRAATPRCWTRSTRWPRNIRVYGDKESVVFEGMVHRDNLAKFADLLAEQILNAALRRRRLHAQPPGRARLHHQDAARKRRRGSGQAGAWRRCSTPATPTATHRRGRSRG